MTATLIGHDDAGFKVWQDEATGGVLGGPEKRKDAEGRFKRIATDGDVAFTLAGYIKEFGFTPLEGA